MKSTAPFGVTFDIGGLLTRTAAVLRADPVRFALLTVLPALLCFAVFGVAAVVGASLAGLSLLGLNDVRIAFDSGSTQNIAVAMQALVPQIKAMLISMSVACIICSAIAVAAQGALYVAAEEVIRGVPRRSTLQTIAAGLRHLPSLLVLVAVQAVVMIACSAPVAALIVQAASTESWALGLAAIPVGTVAGVVAVYLFLRLSLALVAAVIDDLGPVAAIARSWQVTKGSMIDYFVATLLMVVASASLSVVSSLVFIVPVLGQLAALAVTLVSMVAPQVWFVLAYAGLSDRVGPRR